MGFYGDGINRLRFFWGEGDFFVQTGIRSLLSRLGRDRRDDGVGVIGKMRGPSSLRSSG